MKVLGIDPGLQVSGYGLVEQVADEVRVLEAGVIRTKRELSLTQRLVQIDTDIEAVLAEHEPEVMAVEDLYSHYKHPRTAILMGHARGVFLLAAGRHGVEVVSYAATRVKKSLLGYGRATKEQVQQAVKTRLRLTELPSPADVADAIAIGMCCLNERQREQVVL